MLEHDLLVLLAHTYFSVCIALGAITPGYIVAWSLFQTLRCFGR